MALGNFNTLVDFYLDIISVIMPPATFCSTELCPAQHQHKILLMFLLLHRICCRQTLSSLVFWKHHAWAL